MGQIARMNRADRFIEEFEVDLTEKLALKPGMNLTVDSVGLAMRECSGEEVIAFARLVDDDGHFYALECEGIYFDPECTDQDDATAMLVSELGITESEAIERLQKADLYD